MAADDERHRQARACSTLARTCTLHEARGLEPQADDEPVPSRHATDQAPPSELPPARDTEIDFRRGLTGIIGPNGAGKTTILEAIAWAIYGAPAARGTNDTIRFARAPGRARVLVELTFELGGTSTA